MRDEHFELGAPGPYARRMSSALLTRRRVVDNCRFRSSLCRA